MTTYLPGDIVTSVLKCVNSRINRCARPMMYGELGVSGGIISAERFESVRKSFVTTVGPVVHSAADSTWTAIYAEIAHLENERITEKHQYISNL